jgi:hypothetical protein
MYGLRLRFLFSPPGCYRTVCLGTLEELREFVAWEKVTKYTDPNLGVQKYFRRGGPLEWYHYEERGMSFEKLRTVKEVITEHYTDP